MSVSRYTRDNGTVVNFANAMNEDGSLNVKLKDGSNGGSPAEVNVTTMSKGTVTSVISDKSASFESTEFEAIGYNALDLNITITGTAVFAVKIKGAQLSGGIYTDRYDVGLFNASRGLTIPQVSDYYKIEIVLKSGTGKCFVDVQPCNVYGSLQRPSYKEYIMAINETLAANAESAIFTVYNTDWVRGIKLLVKSPIVGYQPSYRDMASNGDISGGNNIGSAQTLANFWRSSSLNPGSFVPPAYGMQFSLKNTDAALTGLVQAHIILMGA
ncbi:hypothetical protein FHS14_003493 [Paenibacillus baekrokdamisoli]|nr:hypothetical protein [Paenibacillus baekrokdamisoli]MBB3070491.1 hypothetical protein [Paenibacillus baekrokdamisoli]